MAIDLFAGVGGMSMGAVQAGVKVAFAVEQDRYAVAAYRANHPHSDVFADDIRKLGDRDLRNIPDGGGPTVVFGGPPCQGFSYSNSRTRTLDNASNWLFEEFLRVVKVRHPDFVVLENVQGIANTAKGLFLHTILDRFDDLGYIVNHGILHAFQFGVPQKRSRFFLIASRAAPISLPIPRQGQAITVREAIGDLPVLRNGASVSVLPYRHNRPSPYARSLRGGRSSTSGHLVTKSSNTIVTRYRTVPPGGNWMDIPEHLMGNYKDRTRCHTGIYHRLRNDEPSVVIGNYRKNMLIHPTQARGLSVREAARIQSFPDSYRFAGTIGFQQQQVANAVPPRLAKAVFQQIVPP